MDHWVDRPEVQARQRAQPTGTNRPTRTTHTHTHTHPHQRPSAPGRAANPNPASTTQPRTNPPHPPQGGGRPPGAAHHNPTTVPAATAGGETPGPIPNPEAKPPSANGTAPTRERKSRTPPEHTPPARAGRAPQPGAHPHAGQTHKHTLTTQRSSWWRSPVRTTCVALDHGGPTLVLECEVRVPASGARRRRAPRSARSPGNRRARHLTSEHVPLADVLAGQVTISRVK